MLISVKMKAEKWAQLFFCPSLAVSNGVYNIPHMPSIVGWLECRLYSKKALWFPVYVTLLSGGSSGMEGTLECKQHSRWAWPLPTQIAWTPYDRRGQQPWNIIAAAHRLSFYRPNEKPLLQQAVLSHFCTQTALAKYNASTERRVNDLRDAKSYVWYFK